jgi:hypothetical protein
LIDAGLVMEQHDDTRCDLCGAPLRPSAETCLCWRCLAAQVIGSTSETAQHGPVEALAPDHDERE